MAYREFRVVDIRAILGWWFRGLGLRAIARKSGFDRRTVRRYVEAAEAEGLTQEAEDRYSLSDQAISFVFKLPVPEYLGIAVGRQNRSLF